MRAGFNDLPDFIHHLWARGVDCEPRRLITVVTGSDASSLQGQLKPAPGDAPVRVIYAALADPAELAARPNGRNDRNLWQAFYAAFTKRFPASDLGDGWAIMSHDALGVAADQAVIKISASQGQVTARNVRGELGDLSASNAVPGQAGDFGFDPVRANPDRARLPGARAHPGRRAAATGRVPAAGASRGPVTPGRSAATRPPRSRRGSP